VAWACHLVKRWTTAPGIIMPPSPPPLLLPSQRPRRAVKSAIIGKTLAGLHLAGAGASVCMRGQRSTTQSSLTPTPIPTLHPPHRDVPRPPSLSPIMRRASSVFICSVLLLAPLAVHAAPKRRGLFERMAAAVTGRETQESGIEAIAAKASGLADALGAMVDRGQGEDSWAEDRDLIMLQKMLNGDSFSIFDNLANAEGLEEVWSKPKVVFRMLQAYPILEGIKGVKDLMAKKEEELTSKDGMDVLASIRQLVSAYTAKMAQMGKADGLKEIFTSYRNNPDFMPLFAKVDAGGDDAQEASMLLQQKVADDVWGGLIDLKAFGLDGTEPRALTEARDRVMKNDPKTWNLITQDNPMIKSLLENPLKAAEILTEGLDPTHQFQLPKYR